MASKEKTQTRTAISNRNGGARALAGCVMGVCVFNAALAAGACAVSASWGCVLPALGLALASAVSVATFAAIREGGAS